MPMEVLKRNLDGMEAVKMNVFHWHLSENQGFRVEAKTFRSCINWDRRDLITRKTTCVN